MVGAKRQVALAFLGLAMTGVLTAAQQGGAAGQAPAGQVPAPPGRGAGGAAAGQGADGGRGGRGAGAAQDTTPVGVTIAGEVPNFVPVTDEMLKNPDPANWPMIRRDYSATDFSPLKEITPANVKDLQLVYMHPMREGGTNQPAPIAHNGVIYLANTGGILQAINGVTGKIIWETKVQGNIAMRGIAIYQDKIFFANGNNISAVDARNGKPVWSTNIGHGNSSGPIVANGKVIEGMGGCSQFSEDKCFLSAYDAATGKEAWRFYTVAKDGEEGGNTWGKLPNKMRAGSEMWITGSYDPVLNLTYWGTAQAKPWMTLTRGTEDDALYTSSTLAINARRRKEGVVFPACTGRGARSRCRVRARAGRQRWKEPRFHHRQGRHSVETRSQNRPVSRA